MTIDNRPTKKQRELLNFLDSFIKGNGYGPSYREVMRALDYKSVSTVATHIDGLIARGYLEKKDNSARSLKVVIFPQAPAAPTDNDSPEVWLTQRATQALKSLQQPDDREHIYHALELLGLCDAAADLRARFEPPDDTA